jgi:hypothetical protein
MSNESQRSALNHRRYVQLFSCIAVFLILTAVGCFALVHGDHAARAATGDAPASTSTTTTQPATVGTIPDSAWQQGGGIDLSKVPDFVPAVSGGKIVGYIPKGELFPTSGTPQDIKPTPQSASSGPTPSPTAADIAGLNADAVKTVYASDLTTVVGHMYPNVGFVPVGQAPPAATTPTTWIPGLGNTSPPSSGG